MRRHDQAIAEITRARELDPLSPGVNATVGFVLSSAGRYDQASEALKKTLELDRSYPYTHLFRGHLHTAQKKSRRGHRGLSSGRGTRPRHASTRISLGAAYARAGQDSIERGRFWSSCGPAGNMCRGRVGDPPGRAGRAGAGVTSLEEAYRARELQLQSWASIPGSIRCARTRAFRTCCDGSVSPREAGGDEIGPGHRLDN